MNDFDDAANEMNGKSPAALARLRERQRCEAIVNAGRSVGNLTLAQRLAFNTASTRGEAIKLLGANFRTGPTNRSGWDAAFGRRKADAPKSGSAGAPPDVRH